jgi:membrane-associated phospholipid phosphatase
MTMIAPLASHPESFAFWLLLTRLGEAQILLPLALLTMGSVLWRAKESGGRAAALGWLALLCLAISLTTASKIAFMGWGLGWAALDFTGVSGHSMFAAAVYPMLAGTLAARWPPGKRYAAIVAGCALALLVGVSRLVIGVHSPSEVVAGLLLGGLASALPFAWAGIAHASISPLVPALVAVWLVIMPVQAPASTTHSLVTRLSLMLSGRSEPFTRADLQRSEHGQVHGTSWLEVSL